MSSFVLRSMELGMQVELESKVAFGPYGLIVFKPYCFDPTQFFADRLFFIFRSLFFCIYVYDYVFQLECLEGFSWLVSCREGELQGVLFLFLCILASCMSGHGPADYGGGLGRQGHGFESRCVKLSFCFIVCCLVFVLDMVKVFP